MKKKVLLMVAVTGMMLSMPRLATAYSSDANDVVRDARGNVVRSLQSGNCVRTQWQGGDQDCGGAPKYRLARTLTKEEKVVYFEFNSARLTPAAQRRLDTLATVLRGDHEVESAKIVGYADRIGNSSANITLSQKRAKAVQDYLARRGYMNTSLAEVRGLGESNSVTNCPSDSRTKNRKSLISCLGADRRVEVEIQFTTGSSFWSE